MTDFAAILPAAVIADLLGVPATDHDQFRSWSSQLVQVDVTHGHTSDALAAAASIYAYFTDFLADRRHNPREDLMSALANATVDGVGLTDEEVLGFARCCWSRATRPPPTCWGTPRSCWPSIDRHVADWSPIARCWYRRWRSCCVMTHPRRGFREP